MTNEEILKLRPGDPIVAVEVDEDDDGVIDRVRRTEGCWNRLAIDYLRKRAGLPLLLDDDDG